MVPFLNILLRYHLSQFLFCDTIHFNQLGESSFSKSHQTLTCCTPMCYSDLVRCSSLHQAVDSASAGTFVTLTFELRWPAQSPAESRYSMLVSQMWTESPWANSSRVLMWWRHRPKLKKSEPELRWINSSVLNLLSKMVREGYQVWVCTTTVAAELFNR